MINSEKTTVQQSALYVSRVKGCLYGGALGDALGYPVEFKSLTSIQNDYGPDGITAPVKTNGEFVVSDDTQMTLFTLEGLTRGLRTGGNVAEEIRLSYIDWLATQSPQEIGWQPRGSIYHDKVLWHLRAPGNTCLSASRAGAHGTLSDPINDSKGCGGVMRVAPVGLVTVWTADEAFDMGCAVAAMTHGHPSGYLSAGALAFIIRTVMDGSELREATENAIEKLEAISGGQETTSALSNVLSLAEDTTRDPSDAVAQLGEGWVGEEALAIGLYSALKANSFSNAVIVAANHDGDSDSTASIAGQIHGAIYGYDALPSDWIAALDVGPMLDDLSGLLLQTVESE
ncbi:MAG: ADP-ribosylglycohydrolase family protein [Rhodospirillales bacterium]|nr:ADP-ribosylglycohydrolase family protein [Rhodospirillales bacterium]